MDLTQVGAAAQTLGKLVGLGVGAWKLAHTPLGKEDLPLLKEAAENLLALVPGKAPSRPAARQAALVASAFGEAWRQHWALAERTRPGALALAWRDYFFSASPQRLLLTEASRRIRVALSQPAGDAPALQPEDPLAEGPALAREPLGSATYRLLFEAFTQPSSDGEAPLLPLAQAERLGFERRFLRAYHEGLASPEAADLRELLLRIDPDRARLVRDLLVADMASWGERNLFGSSVPLPGLPAMPLEAMYVEPQATVSKNGAGTHSGGARAVLGLLETLGAKEPVVLVLGDFGLGKSMTARMRALHLARRFLEGAGASPELELPVFVRCGEDFTVGEIDLDRVLRRAAQRHARTLGLELPISDPALAPPGPEQRAVFLLDGLDEVALGERQVTQLLRELRDRAGSRHRFVVFSRPPTIPRAVHGPELPRVRLRELTTQTREKQPGGQVAEWLRRWNALRPDAPPLEVQALAARRLLDLAGTPILLFMIAFTWSEDDRGALTRLELFERFFEQLARGKHELDAATHPPIAQASERLREALAARGILRSAASEPHQAMLWLLGRTAWEALRHETQGTALSGADVERIVREELGIAESVEAARSIRSSLLLVLQADLDGGEPRILFGHRAFKEFLVARHWAGVLRRIAAAPVHAWPALEAELCGGRLIEPDGSAHGFLLQLLFPWDDAERARLLEWAAQAFNDERLPEGCHSFADDPRPLLREAALFIGSMLPESGGLVARTPTTLRSLLAWLWLHRREPQLRATRLRSPGAALDDATLAGAWLDHADLRGASLLRANLRDAHLFRANLAGARMDGAHLLGARADELNLEGATLRETFLSNASLCRARMAGATAPQCAASSADLRGADLSGATFNGAWLNRANLHGATLHQTQLSKAKLAGAVLDAADLSGANLHQADLRKASLAGAGLRGAILRDADLRGANLKGADLRDADLAGALLDDADLTDARR